MHISRLATVAALAAAGTLLANARRPTGRAHLGVDLERDTYLRLPAGGALAAGAALVAGGMLLAAPMRRGRHAYEGDAAALVQAIDVDVSLRTAYNQWTQFEEFPKFMDTVEAVRQVDDTHLHWRAVVGGKPKEWDAEITEQVPDQRIAWRSTGGVRNAGAVSFHKLADDKTRVMLQMDYEPETLAERVGDALGAVRRTARGNLRRFKRLVEARGVETGAWRGTVATH